MCSWPAVGDSTPRWSIAVLLQRSPEAMEQTLLSVLENAPAAAEVLLVLDQRYDDPYELEGEVRFVRAGRRASWSRCANAALAAARGQWLQLLPAGARVTPQWCQWLEHLPPGASPGAVALGIDQTSEAEQVPSRQTEPADHPAFLDQQPQWDPWHPGRIAEQLSRFGQAGAALFFHRESVLRAGGWRMGLATPWAEVELVHRLLQQGHPLALAPDCTIQLPGPAASRSALGRGWYRRRLRLAVHSPLRAVWEAAAGFPGLLLALAARPHQAGETLLEALGGLSAWLTYPVLRPELPPAGAFAQANATVPLKKPDQGKAAPCQGRRKAA